jgi:hypothetical protein
MSDTTKTVETAKHIGAELGKAAAKATVQTAVEMAAATALLVTVGLVANKVQERRAKKAASQQEEPSK